MDIKTIFASRLKELRTREGLKQDELADKIGISRGSLSFYENKDRLPTIDILQKIAQYFNVSADYLIGSRHAPTTDIEDIAINEKLGLSNEAITKLRELKERDGNTLVGSQLRIGTEDDCETFKLKSGRTVTLEEIMKNPNNYPGIKHSPGRGISFFTEYYSPHNHLAAINRIVQDDNVEEFLTSLVSYLFGIKKDDKKEILIDDLILGKRQLSYEEISEIILNDCMRFFRNMRNKISKEKEEK